MAALLSTSPIVPLSPANTVTEVPVVVLLPVEVDRPVVALLLKPLDVTVAVSPLRAFAQVFTSVRLALLRVLVWVQVMAVSAALMVSALPTSAVPLPEQDSVAS